MNAGFEVGTSGWRYYIKESPINPQNANYIFESPQTVSNDVVEGKSCLEVNPIPSMQTVLESFGLKLEPGTQYTLSSWMKAKHNSALVALQIAGNKKQVALSDSWQRYTLSFIYTGSRDNLNYVGYIFEGSAVLLDAVQLEKGESPTPYQPVSEFEIGGSTDQRFNLINQNDTASLIVQIHSNKKGDETISIQALLEDYKLQPVQNEQINCILPHELKLKGGNTVTYRVPLNTSHKGGFRLLLSIKSGSETLAQYPVVFAIIPKPIACTNPANSPFCAEPAFLVGNIGHFRVYYGYTSVNEYLDLLQRFGIHGTREQLWQIDPQLASEQTSIDWFDYWLNGLKGRGIVPYNAVQMFTGKNDTNIPYKPGGSIFIPNESKIREQVHAMADHYRGRFSAYEIGWETESWADPENFAKVAKWMVAELRKTDPTAKIVGICPSLDQTWASADCENSWLGKTLPLVHGLFDAITAHLYYESYFANAEYGIENQTDNKPSFADIVSGLKSLLAENTYSTDLWSNTEGGVAGSTMYAPYYGSMHEPDIRIPALQAEHVVKQMLIGLANGIRRWHYFTFNCIANEDMSFFEWNMTPRPVAASWCQLSQRIENYTLVSQVKTSKEISAYKVNRASDGCIVYWQKNGSADEQLLIPASPVKFVIEDIMGNEIPQQFSRDGKIILPLSGAPYYISGSAKAIEVVAAALGSTQAPAGIPRLNLTKQFNGNIPEQLRTAFAMNQQLRQNWNSITLCRQLQAPGSVTLFKVCIADTTVVYVLGNKTTDSLRIKLETRKIPGNARKSSGIATFASDTEITSYPYSVSVATKDTAEIEHMFSHLSISGKPHFLCSAISFGNPAPGAKPGFVITIKNTGTSDFSAKLQLKSMPDQTIINPVETIAAIHPGDEQTICFVPRQIKTGIQMYSISAQVKINGAIEYDIPEQSYFLVGCPATNRVDLLDDVTSTPWTGSVDLSLPFIHDSGNNTLDSLQVSLFNAGAGKGLFIKTIFHRRANDLPGLKLFLDASPTENLLQTEGPRLHTGELLFSPLQKFPSGKYIQASSGLYEVSDLFSSEARVQEGPNFVTGIIRIPLQTKVKPMTVFGFRVSAIARVKGIEKQKSEFPLALPHSGLQPQAYLILF
jgi:hypothetical protein